MRFTLNCPICRKRLVHVPLDGLTLHYRCERHGLLIFKPLVVVRADDLDEPAATHDHTAMRPQHDAA